MPIVSRRELLANAAGSVATLAFSATLAGADDYPTRPVRFIVTLAPGGGLDFVARVTAEYISRGLGQQVVVENRTGAGGTIGVDAAIKSAPDGYSILVTNDNVVSAPHILRLNAEFIKDLAPISCLARQPQVVGVHPSLGIGGLAELIALAKERPGMACATSGVGSNQHVLLEWFARSAGIRFEHVPYRGAGQAVNDFLAGHVKVAVLGPTALVSHYRAGALRLVAQSGETRSPSLPEVPTIAESGFKDVAIESWYAAFAPAGTPQPIVARLNAEMDKAMRDAATRETLLKTATEPVGGGADKLAAMALADSAKYARLVRELNIKAG